MRRLVFFLFFGVALILSVYTSGQASGISLEEIIANVQKVYQGTKDLTADFIQESTLKSISKTQLAKGKIYFKNPGKLFWDYYGATKQEIITDGETLWMYFPEDKQVIINELKNVYRSNTSTFFLSGMGKLKRDFDIQLVEPDLGDEEKGYLLKLIPKEQQSSFNELFLFVNKDTFLVVETYFHDFYGNLIRIKFKNHMVNQALSDSMFVFSIPTDVEVVKPHQMIQGR